MATTITVSSQAQLNAAIEQADQASSGTFDIVLSGNITEGQSGQPVGLYALDLSTGVSVTINGDGQTISGGGVDGGLAVIVGKVSINDLTIEDTVAKGAAGTGSGGGGAGLGGGLFVGQTADVSLNDVLFRTNAAVGGAGGKGGNGGTGGHSSLIVPPLGAAGVNGAAGAAGANGTAGPQVTGGAGGAGHAGGQGGLGQPGGKGGAGGKGGVGGAGTYSSTYGFRGGHGGAGGQGSLGGVGGAGGDGGAGGQGGQGGHGVGNFDTPQMGTRGPNASTGGSGGVGGAGKTGGYGAGGGAGGAGGAGGKGGQGGAGAHGQNQTVTATGMIGSIGFGGTGGVGGAGGTGGKGGAGAAGGFGGGGGGGGAGGAGGQGGQGGVGGTGGSYSRTSGVAASPPKAGSGGYGGMGGLGGTGGWGGKGGTGGFGGGGGGGGKAGAAGAGGKAGVGGPGGINHTNGVQGPSGSAGDPGSAGTNGPNGSAGGGGFGGGAGSGTAGGGGLGAGGGIFVAQGGVLTFDGGLLTGDTVTGGTGANNGQAFGGGIFIEGDETITLAATSAMPLTIGNQIADQRGVGGTAGTGGLVIQGPGAVDLDANNSFVGGIAINSGTLELGHTGAAGSGPISFAGSGGLLFAEADVPTVPIDAFGSGDTITVSSFLATGSSYAGGTLTLSGLPKSVALDIRGHTLSGFVVTDNSVLDETIITASAPCFCGGTLIRTTHGDIPVERLQQGDRVLALDGGARPIRWIGHRRLDLARHRAPDQMCPVRVRAGALAEGVPSRDLFLSPDHAVLFGAVLVPVRLLVNGSSITRDHARRSVTYFHVELDRHDVLWAENLPAESYLDTGNRGMFANTPGPLQLHPDLANHQERREGESCRPLAVTPGEVEPVWRALAARAAAIGLPVPEPAPTTGVPNLSLLAEAIRIPPAIANMGVYSFILPAHLRSARLFSHAVVPVQQTPWNANSRRLGVMVGSLRLRHGGRISPISLDDPRLDHGWWQPEIHAGVLRRWTDGDALIPLPAVSSQSVLEVSVAASLEYPVIEAATRRKTRALAVEAG